ncbi:porin [Pustulibacterium marinum]|nr:porin [Pustulibacterium marinum]
MKMINLANIVKKSVFILAVLGTSSVFSQDADSTATKKFSLSGSVDAYYRANITAPNDENAIAPGTSFANLPGFALGMANVVASYEGEKVGFVADLVFGPRGTDAVFVSPMYSATGDIINQLYAYWNVSDAVTFTFGNFNTFLGYEVISPVGNFNYSTSYMFSYGPFSHTGLKADFAISEDFSAMLAVMNSTDFTEFNPDGKYTLGGQLGYKGQFLNLLYGNQTSTMGLATEPTFQIDYTGGFDLSDSFFLGINATYNDTDGVGFYGAALYPQYSVSEDFALGLRAEYFGENGDFGAIGTGVEDSSVMALTLTGNYMVEDLTIKPELRLDSASEEAFIDNDLMASKSLASFLVAVVYSF